MSAAEVFRDLALEGAIGKRRRKAAFGLDLLKQRPGLFGERLGQRLEAARARGRIFDEAEMGFAQEDELSVAGEPSRQTAG